jgi:sterol desaturase/sphingolipid hydroxylase (fatty acid hydroxylase superfamily)
MRSLGPLRCSIERLCSTRINSWLGLVSDVGVSVLLLWAAFRLVEVRAVSACAIVAIGIFAFSFAEYCLHRWLFHGRSAIFERGHRRHHERPQGDDSLPFFLAPLAILSLAEVLRLATAQEFALLFTGGFAAGYAAYGLTHTLIHRVRFPDGLARRWARAHHVHHYHPDSNFGVTTPFWDFVMSTRYDRSNPKALSRS